MGLSDSTLIWLLPLGAVAFYIWARWDLRRMDRTIKAPLISVLTPMSWEEKRDQLEGKLCKAYEQPDWVYLTPFLGLVLAVVVCVRWLGWSAGFMVGVPLGALCFCILKLILERKQRLAAYALADHLWRSKNGEYSA